MRAIPCMKIAQLECEGVSVLFNCLKFLDNINFNIKQKHQFTKFEVVPSIRDTEG